MEKAKRGWTRRKLITVFGLVGTAAGAALINPIRDILLMTASKVLKSKQPAQLARWRLSLADANYDDWQALVGQSFSVGGGYDLKLAGVRAFPQSGARPSSLARDRAFVLLLDVQNRRTLPGDLIYTVNHRTHGAFSVFLSRAVDARAPGRMLAVFN